MWRRRKDVHLPTGRHFAITSGIPDNFGGLTKTMLQRSCSFAQLAGTPVTVLTFSLQTNLDEVRVDLRKRGLLVDGVVLENLWEELLDFTDDELRDARVDPSVPETPDPRLWSGGSVDAEDGDTVRAWSRPANDDVVVEVFRRDGTLLARQSWRRIGTRTPTTRFGDLVLDTTLWARDGTFIGGWRGTWGLWDFWFSRKIGDQDSVVIADGTYVGDFVTTFQHDNCVTLYLFHNNHLAPRRDPAYAPLERIRRHVSEHVDDFDGVVFLTSQQRRDFELLRGSIGNAHVISNVRVGNSPNTDIRRSGTRGVALARFTRTKRLDHAIRAAAKSSAGIELHFFGSGQQEDSWKELAAELNAPVFFDGYTDSPDDELARASFMLLTSTHEGQGLVITEAMANGCIPIAYDICYGPAHIISHGVDGFLVPAGNWRALADQIDEFLQLSPRRVQAMRKAARARARDFDPEVIIPQWNEAMLHARKRRQDRPARVMTAGDLHRAELDATTLRSAEREAHVELVKASWLGPTSLTMTLCAHVTGGDEIRSPADVSAEIVHRPTGSRQPLTIISAPHDRRPNDPSSAAYVTLHIDTEQVEHPLDHTILVDVEAEGCRVTDTIMHRRRLESALPMPAATAERPVLVFSKGRGIDIASARPKVAATAAISANEVTLDLRLLIEGKIEGVEARSLGSQSAIAGTLVDPGKYRFDVDSSGRWEFRAVISGKSRLVSWGPPSAELPSDPLSSLQLTLTPRGYLRMESAPVRACATEVLTTADTTLVISSGESSPSVLALDAKGGVHSLPQNSAGPTRHEVQIGGLPAGTHHLHWGPDRGELPVGTELQDQLPLDIPIDGGSVRFARRPHVNALVVTVTRP